jgi:RHS repeat-associated protein
LPDNKRVWKKAPGGAETVYFYGVGGQKLITYTLQTSPVALLFQSENVYFAGKLIRANGVSVVHDRLGSVVARGDSSSSVITKHDYLPYGEEMGTATGGNVDKFGTYLRDQTTGLDHADQRYFAGTLGGRFLSSDPYEASGGAGEPGSWNRFAYVGGDPVNFNDRSGLTKCRIAGYNGQQAQVFCASTVDPGVWGWGWVDAPGGSGLPLDENGEWARGVTDRAATSAWGSNLDRMAAGRNQTTAQYRPAAIRAISGLHENCRRLFDSRIVSTGGTILAALSNAADSSMFYDSNGAEGQMTFTQATGLSVMGGAQGPAEDPYILVSLLEPTHRAITLTFGGNALPHIVLSNGFSQLSADQQSAILIHELLHVVLGDHLPIINALGIPNDYIVTHFGNESFAITECVLNGCPK